MFNNVTPVRLRMTGGLLCLAGVGLYLGAVLAFQWLPITLLLSGALGWLTATGYTAIGLAVIGAVLLFGSMVPRRL